MEFLRLFREKDNTIRSNERLVSPDFQINIAAEIKKGSLTRYPDYPSPRHRLHMSPAQIAAWKEKGGRTQDLPDGKYAVKKHPNYLDGLQRGRATQDDGLQDFHNTAFPETFYGEGYQRDERGLPIRPHDEDFLQAGAVEGIGFYWNYGPNKAADPVVFRQNEGKLQLLVIERRDMSSEGGRFRRFRKRVPFVALPGGMVDKQEPSVSAAVRELFEEAGLDLGGVKHEVVHQGIVWADPRTTRHAWPESTVALLMPDSEKTDNVKLRGGDDARTAKWIDVNEKNVNGLFASHGSFVKLALLRYEQLTGFTTDKKGKLKKSNLSTTA